MKKRTLLLIVTLMLGSGLVAAPDSNNSPAEREKTELSAPAESAEHAKQKVQVIDEKPVAVEGKIREESASMAGDDVLETAPASAPAVKFHAGTTIQNLQDAFNGESNASAKYAAFAKKADEEGYKAVASLFRAASHAEKIHAENHADVIRSLGAEPKADIKPVEVKGTEANLKAAVEGETFERDVMYPAYMKVARNDRNRNALRTFNYAQIAESHHAAFYKEAGEKLVEYKDSEGVTWYVCPTCGETVRASDFEKMTKCPVCFTRTRTFEPIS
jgi:rubrerythrin